MLDFARTPTPLEALRRYFAGMMTTEIRDRVAPCRRPRREDSRRTYVIPSVGRSSEWPPQHEPVKVVAKRQLLTDLAPNHLRASIDEPPDDIPDKTRVPITPYTRTRWTLVVWANDIISLCWKRSCI